MFLFTLLADPIQRLPGLAGLPTAWYKRPMDQITIEEFRRIDLRVATVTSATAHPNADRLVVLTVDLGSEQRQLVAGIRAHYEPEHLVGRQVVVVANLAPATLRGVESQGMLLAATDSSGSLAIVGPEHPLAAGASVR